MVEMMMCRQTMLRLTSRHPNSGQLHDDDDDHDNDGDDDAWRWVSTDNVEINLQDGQQQFQSTQFDGKLRY